MSETALTQAAQHKRDAAAIRHATDLYKHCVHAVRKLRVLYRGCTRATQSLRYKHCVRELAASGQQQAIVTVMPWTNGRMPSEHSLEGSLRVGFITIIMCINSVRHTFIGSTTSMRGIRSRVRGLK
jgi:hypothetical protein